MTGALETQIAAWRSYAQRRHAIGTDTAELEGHLRDRITDLTASGLSEDEAFLVAVKRMGSLDSLTREFAREHSDRLWKQLVLVDEGITGSGRRDIAVMFAFAVGAAVLVKIPILMGVGLDTDHDISFWGRNAALLALAPLAGYLLQARGSRPRVWAGVAALGENLILLANLAWSAGLLWRLVGGRAAPSLLQRWQAGYLTVYAAWAWLVVLAFPLVFGLR